MARRQRLPSSFWPVVYGAAPLLAFVLAGVTILDWVKPVPYDNGSDLKCSSSIMIRFGELTSVNSTLTDTMDALARTTREDLPDCSEGQRTLVRFIGGQLLARGSGAKR